MPPSPGHRRRARHRAARAATHRVGDRAGPRPRALPRGPRRDEGDLRLPVDRGLRRRRQPVPHRRADHRRWLGGASASPGAAAALCTTRGTRKRKLPDLAPDPFREREELLAAFLAEPGGAPGPRRSPCTDEFVAQGAFPFFATFLHELGFDVGASRPARTSARSSAASRRRNVPFCAPMQLVPRPRSAEMADGGPDFLFLPMLRSLPPEDGAIPRGHVPDRPGQPRHRAAGTWARERPPARLAGHRHRRERTAVGALPRGAARLMAEALGAGSASPPAMESAFQAQRSSTRAARAGPGRARLLPGARHPRRGRARPPLHRSTTPCSTRTSRRSCASRGRRDSRRLLPGRRRTRRRFPRSTGATPSGSSAPPTRCGAARASTPSSAATTPAAPTASTSTSSLT